MEIKKTFCYKDRTYSGNINEPSFCPRCHFSIKPEELYCGIFSNNENKTFCASLYLCPHCYETFSVLYSINFAWKKEKAIENYYFTSSELYRDPQRFSPKNFEKVICSISPDFVRIYNEAEYAEFLGLNSICGIGYRKALEFLVKDFCIYFNPTEEKKIKKELLSESINKRISNERIKILALRSAWLGNDEAHYTRKHENRDVKDLKTFIEACVYFVGMTMALEDASSISPE